MTQRQISAYLGRQISAYLGMALLIPLKSDLFFDVVINFHPKTEDFLELWEEVKNDILNFYVQRKPRLQQQFSVYELSLTSSLVSGISPTVEVLVWKTRRPQGLLMG